MDNYIQVKPSGGGGSPLYTRPTDWLSFPSVGSTEEVAYFLYAVWDTTFNPVAMSFSGGNYTVEVLSYSSPVNKTAGSVWEDNFVYSSVTSSVTSRGYKTVVIKVTPQSGQTITGFSLNHRHSSFAYYYQTGLLDMSINFASITSAGFYSNNVLHDNCEKVHLKTLNSITSMDYMFYLYRGLRTINQFDTSAVTTAVSAFEVCRSLIEVPTFDFGNLTNTGRMFLGCLSLTVMPPFDMKKVTNMIYFAAESGIVDLSGLQLRDVVTIYLMGYNSYNIAFYPDFSNCNSITGNVEYTFYGHSLNEYPNVKMAGVTTITNWLYGANTLGNKQYRKINSTGCVLTHSLANHLLDANAIDAYFTGLGTVTAKVVTVTGNPGAGSCTNSIATAKGWTVVN